KESHRKFLEKVSTILSESLEYKATIDRVVSLALDSLGDWCSLVLLAEDGSIEQMTMAHANAEFLNGITDVRLRWSASSHLEFPVAKVISTGEAVHVPRLTPEILACMDITTAPGKVGNLVGCSFVAVPLKARGHVLGVLSLMRGPENR